MRLPSLARFFAVSLVAALFLVVLAAGCGRSSLEIETVEGGITPGNCGPSNCPSGCCDANGICRVGSDTRACGTRGIRCLDCVANGFTFCDGRRVCGRDVTNCGPGECPTGCCSTEAGRSTCLAGTDPGACGRSGQSCIDCARQGRSCDFGTRACSVGRCDASNCPGCCVGDQCLPGSDSGACGARGEQCRSCTATGQVCQSTPGGGGQCQGTPTCGPANCGGCCLGTTCVSGTDSTACGRQGLACSNCQANGRVCVPQGQPNERTCQLPVTCGPANCPGCCVGNECVVATTPAACGRNGEVCRGCGLNEACNAGVCIPAPNCGPANCAGCCIGNDICAVGNQNTACGAAGVQCLNCAGQGRVCQGGACQVPACGPANCAGCCQGNTCVIGVQDNACGGGGQQCNDCTQGAQVCTAGQCRDRCGPANCAGCCTTSNACALGFANGACGSGGAACVNCTGAGSTCNGLVNPRVCNNQQNTCPAPYGACPDGVTTPITPSLQNHCDDLDLDGLQGACAGGQETGTCAAAFALLAAVKAPCAACLAPFNVPLGQLSGIYACVAPFVDVDCNRSTGCAMHCQTTSCSQCPPASTEQCRSQVGANGGQCFGLIAQTSCIQTQGAVDPGDLCSPLTYPPIADTALFSRWFRAVGDHFCGNGP
ncbi:MAG: hypothetical protein KF819_22100 [Labilithrix sp.]|nr:hypothetical protein [Labilithrix sp.]